MDVDDSILPLSSRKTKNFSREEVRRKSEVLSEVKYGYMHHIYVILSFTFVCMKPGIRFLQEILDFRDFYLKT